MAEEVRKPNHALLQTEEMDAFAEHKAEAIKSATDRGLIGL